MLSLFTRRAKKPNPLLSALGALVLSGLFGYLLYKGTTTGVVDFRRLHFSLAEDPEMYWFTEAFLAVLLVVSLIGLFVSVRAVLRREPAASGPPPELK